MTVSLIIISAIIIGVIGYFISESNKKPQSNSPDKPTQGERKINVAGPAPECESDYSCFKFVATTPKIILEPWYKAMLGQGRTFTPTYEQAIKQKLQTGEFKNPIDFDEYFGNIFDYIAIDFETANDERISACAIGYAFIKDNAIVDDDYDYIKPPRHITFSSRHIEIHNIDAECVENSSDFLDLWNYKLKELFNNNILLLHNSSMDASVLRQLFLYYNITDHNIRYVDTMNIAKKNGYPGKLKELCSMFNITFTNQHDPASDAIACAQVAGEFEDKGIILTDYVKTI